MSGDVLTFSQPSQLIQLDLDVNLFAFLRNTTDLLAMPEVYNAFCFTLHHSRT